MKIKDMRRSNWSRVLEKEYTAKTYTENGMKYLASLTILKKLTGPLVIDGVMLADTNYRWLQIAAEGQYVWLTAMYDDKGGLIQLYFDITAGNRFDDPDNPFCEDMYLDVSLWPGGEISVLDRDELDEALARGEITHEAYCRALDVCQRLHDWLTVHKDKAVARCDELLHELEKAL